MKASACLTEDERNVSLFHLNGNRFCRGAAKLTFGCAAFVCLNEILRRRCHGTLITVTLIF